MIGYQNLANIIIFIANLSSYVIYLLHRCKHADYQHCTNTIQLNVTTILKVVKDKIWKMSQPQQDNKVMSKYVTSFNFTPYVFSCYSLVDVQDVQFRWHAVIALSFRPNQKSNSQWTYTLIEDINKRPHIIVTW